MFFFLNDFIKKLFYFLLLRLKLINSSYYFNEFDFNIYNLKLFYKYKSATLIYI